MLFKVCCIQSAAEMQLAAAHGASHVGLVGAMPSGPGPLPDSVIEALIRDAPERITPVLLTSRTTSQDIAAHLCETGARAVQIVTDVPPAVRRERRAELPDLKIVQVVHVEGAHSVDVALRAADDSDFVLLDSGRPAAAVPELGGTGRTHDWAVSADIVARLPVPVFLAGGLRPDNVSAALHAVRPAGVDLCSGIRDGGGRLDPVRLRAFAGAVGPASLARAR